MLLMVILLFSRFADMAGVAIWNKSPRTSGGYTFSSFGVCVVSVAVVSVGSALIGKSQSSGWHEFGEIVWEYDASLISLSLRYVHSHQPDVEIGLNFQRVPQRLLLEKCLDAFPTTRTILPTLPSQPANSLITIAKSPFLHRAMLISFLAASPHWQGQQYGTNSLGRLPVPYISRAWRQK